MKLSQLRAISKSYAEKREKENEADLIKRNLDVVYKQQTKYRTMTGLLKASDKNIAICKAEAIERVTARIAQLEQSKCTSYTMTEARSELEKLTRLSQESVYSD